MTSPRTLTRLALIAAAVQAVTACASFTDTDAPVCDGRHRRPANPWGSILAPQVTPSAILSPQAEPKAPAPAPAVSSTLSPGDTGGCQ